MGVSYTSLLYCMGNGTMKINGFDPVKDSKEGDYVLRFTIIQTSLGKPHPTEYRLSKKEFNELEQEIIRSGRQKTSKAYIHFDELKKYVACNQGDGVLSKIGKSTGVMGALARRWVKLESNKESADNEGTVSQ